MRRGRLTLIALIFVNTATSLWAEEISFNRDIRPILSDNCFYCHGTDAKNRKAGRRLDTFEGAMAESDGVRAIIAGNVDSSALWTRINSQDQDEVMPPPKSHKSLTTTQREKLRRWIEQGAKYEPHWSFAAIAPAILPPVKRADWPRNDIDRYVLARLDREDLTPSPEAARETLIRRVSLDLTGLPPTLTEVDEFVADQSELAYEKVVDRLLKSPHYGERMAVDWLDVARYADSNGYQVDRDREMWPWRDWVIKAFNDNQPFDQFTIEQIAGDLLPNATLEQRVATGFHRNHMINEEGGIIPAEFLAEYTADRVETTAAVWLGQTFNCCRCHDHKFDPFTQRDFYSLKAFFHNVPEQGLANRSAKPNASAPPVIALPSPELDARKSELAQRRAEAREKYEALLKQDLPGFGEWLLRVAAQPPVWRSLPLQSVVSDAVEVKLEQNTVKVGPRNDGPFDVTILSPAVAGRITAIRLICEASGRSSQFRWNRLEVIVTADGKQRPLALRPAVAGDSLPAETLRPWLESNNVIPFKLNVSDGEPASAVLALGEPLTGENTAVLKFIVSARASTEITHWHIELSEDDPDLFVPSKLMATAGKAPEVRTPEETQALRSTYASLSPQARALDEELRRLSKELDSLEQKYPASMVMEEMPKPRDTFILVRGQYDKPGERVTASTPTVLPAMADDLPRNRLGLAKWLVSVQNPLTARVIVNRFWQQIFGAGLVKTSDDFGAQGESPSHPELLDWLAGEFIRSDWDVKHLMRLMVTSATYRQQSHFTPLLRERDPDNRLLARGPRFRLAGEFVRDQALAASGLLVPTVGGPSVRPYHPPGLYEQVAPTSPDTVKTYIRDKGDALYRRSLYTYWKRSVPHPAMLAFGTPFREVCTLQRPRSNTPIQALNLLNDDTYIEAARLLAERMMQEARDSIDSRIIHGFRLVLARRPKPDELPVLQRAYTRALADFENDTAAAAALLSVGEKPADPKRNPAELAALTTVASTILCMDETVTKQ